MAQTKKQRIDEYKYVYRQAQAIVPKVYASIAMNLIEKHNWTPDQVAELIGESQDSWNSCINDKWDMLGECAEKYGIDLRLKKDGEE